jgi:phosphatidylinositol alpha-1,6-mannosyltransferase
MATDEMMKILLVSNYYYPEHLGGVEIVSSNLVKQYRRAGHQVRWMAADVPPQPRAFHEGDARVRAWNIAEERLGFPHPLPYPEVLPILLSSLKWCDVVHLQDCLYSINILTFAFAKILRKPVLITQYAKVIPYERAYKRLLQAAAYRTLGRWMFRTAEGLVFITSNVREGMMHINPAKNYDVVPLGVDTDFFYPIPDEARASVRNKFSNDPAKPLLLFVGRMVERKGVGIIRPLIQKHPEWTWVLVGRPDDWNPGEWMDANLVFKPRLDESELRDLFASADLLLHPSRGEGITLTVSECMAAGTPVVISNESLFEVAEGDRQLFFGVEQTPESIEAAISGGLSADRADAGARRDACRRFAEGRWSWKSVSERYIGLLKSLVESDE